MNNKKYISDYPVGVKVSIWTVEFGPNWRYVFVYLDASKTMSHVCPNGHSTNEQYRDVRVEANLNWQCITINKNRPIGRVSK